MKEPTIKEKLSILRKTKRQLVKQVDKGAAVGDMLEVVNERINHYVKLQKSKKIT